MEESPTFTILNGSELATFTGRLYIILLPQTFTEPPPNDYDLRCSSIAVCSESDLLASGVLPPERPSERVYVLNVNLVLVPNS
jgi:uncharacterized protein with gpF-like domain